jgi:soluble lytic murein transglycosylase
MVRRVCFGFAFAAALAVSGIAMPAIFQSVEAAQTSGLAVEAARAAFKGHFSEAGDLAQRSGDQAAVKLVELLYLRDHYKDAGYSRIMAFLDAAPKWPLSETLRKRAEHELYADDVPPQNVLAHFANRKPMTPEGTLALARAKLSQGDTASARQLVANAWADNELDPGLEARIVKEFGGMLSQEDHKRRTANLIYAQETNAAIRNAKRLSGSYVTAAKVAQSLIRSAGGAERQYRALPSAMKQWAPIQYALARYYRKREATSQARAALANAPSSLSSPVAQEAWWVEKRLVARQSLKTRTRDAWSTAYTLAKSHGFAKGQFLAEGEFLAGWIALRNLNDPSTALGHFKRLEAGADTRTDKARGAYWVGRTYEALGDRGNADAAYGRAAGTPTVFYGQLAREELGRAKQPISVGSGQASAEARARIDDDEVMRAFRISAAAGQTRELNGFLWSIANRFDSKDEMNAAAEIVAKLGGPATAVRLAKLSGQRGIDIDAWGYPTKALPDWKTIGKPVERALVYGLSRQESEFDPGAGSTAGARGLMQLMPGTARLVARQYRLPYAAGKLTGDPGYNVKLGAAHLGDLIRDYNGSYVLTLVAYNAGPRRAREWVAAYGDPRGGSIDPIDWVEHIPITETRIYVQKVLQNTQIYRSRLAPSTMRPMSADLRRGAPADISVASTSEPGTSHCASIASLITGCE